MGRTGTGEMQHITIKQVFLPRLLSVSAFFTSSGGVRVHGAQVLDSVNG
jgi:hypothetical protein